MANFDELISRLQVSYPDSQERGKEFEHVCKWFLTTDPYYKQEFTYVWLWDEWPERWGPDIGIDLVAHTTSGHTVAIQAKCYQDTVPSKEIDSFIAASSRPEFAERLLITTSDITANTEKKLTNQDKPSPFLLGYSLREKNIDWLAYDDETRSALPDKKKPRSHQQSVVDDVVRGFETNDRGKAIMACGTGKTLVGLWTAEALSSKRTLVLVPSLSLVAQVSREWLENSQTPFRTLFVCSDATVKSDAFVGHTEELGVMVTTSSEEIRDFLVKEGDAVVFATYQSSPRIAEAQTLGAPEFDVTIADEAHHCAGKVDSQFATALDGAQLRSKKRLFMTATPRIVTKRIKDAAYGFDLEVASMDDESVFGKDFHVLTFGEAIAGDLLSDYRVVIMGVSEHDTKNLIDERTLVELEASGFRTDAETLASMVGLIKTINKYDLNHIITFHTRIKQSSDFSNDVSSLIEELPSEQRLSRNHWTRHIAGTMPTGQRTTLLSNFRELPDNQIGILSNARCLNEGVDVRSIDGIAFIEPRRSKVDIVQAVGRALRKSKSSKVGTIIIPVFIEDDVDVEMALSSSRFEPVWSVLQALREHDEVLADEMDSLRRELGRRGSISSNLPSKLVIDMPVRVGTDFMRSLDAKIVDMTTASWEFWFGLLETYKATNDGQVPAFYRTEDGFRLGGWVDKQRQAYKTGKLTEERIRRLEEVGIVWDPLAVAWEEGYAHLTNYKANNDGQVPQSYKTEDGYNLGGWVHKQRSNYKKSKLTDEQVRRLEGLGIVWDPHEAAWEEGRAHLADYKANNDGHVPNDYTTEDGYNLGMWVNTQRSNYKKSKLTDEQVRRLEELGIIWDVLEAAWEEGYEYLADYKANNDGDVNVAAVYKTEDGYNLGVWVNKQRSNYKKSKLTDEQIRRLEGLGIVWDPHKAAWEEGYAYLVDYKANNDGQVPQSYKTEDGFRLGGWVGRQREAYKTGKLTEERIRRLEELGIIWDPIATFWEQGYAYLADYKANNDGDVNMAALYKTEDGFRLGSWINTQRQSYKKGKLTDEQVRRLEEVGIVWDSLEAQWEEGYAYLVEYKANNDGQVPQSYKTEEGYNLGGWVANQRATYKKGKLTDERIRRLEELGLIWAPNKK